MFTQSAFADVVAAGNNDKVERSDSHPCLQKRKPIRYRSNSGVNNLFLRFGTRTKMEQNDCVLVRTGPKVLTMSYLVFQESIQICMAPAM